MGRRNEVEGGKHEGFLLGTEHRSILKEVQFEGHYKNRTEVIRHAITLLKKDAAAKELGRLTLKLAETQQANENLVAENKALREQVAALDARSKRIATQRRRSDYGGARSLAFQ